MGLGSHSVSRTHGISIFNLARIGAAALGLLLPAAIASAQVSSATTAAATGSVPQVQETKTHIVEWDIPMIQGVTDSEPGAITVDTRGKDKNRVWFLTRTTGVEDPQKVYRFDAAKSLMKGSAQWTSWELSRLMPASTTGGLKRLRPSDDRRYVFVRTSSDIQRVDTQKCKPGTAKTATADATPPTCELTIWSNNPSTDSTITDALNVSDLAVDETNRVFTTAAVVVASGVDPNKSYLQMLTPGYAPPPGTTAKVKVTRWQVGGGAGVCDGTGGGGPCLSGIDVYQAKYKNLVFYSEPGSNKIGELNISTNVVRRWSIAAVGASQPRQLNIDNSGKVWVVTGSGHLVSLNPATNRMTRHLTPMPVDSDLFGVAPDDDVIGYTDAQIGKDRVAMLFPKGNAVPVTPDCQTLYPTYPEVLVTADASVSESAPVAPQGKIAPVTITSKDDGTFVEARVAEADCVSGPCSLVPSFSPRGITPNRGKAQGTFFYTVGFSDKIRIGFARLPHKDKPKHGRDDDDCDDGEDAGKHPGWHDHSSHVDDNDDDGVDSKYDTKTTREDAETGDATALGAGQITEYPLTATATSLALIANVTADDPLAQLGVEIYNSLGALVASGASVGGVALATLPLPAAGDYRVRVKNYGLGSATLTPTLLVREPWLP
jgi:hypothetical protein